VLFNSPTYVAFLPAVVAMYWVLPKAYRPVLLIAASYYFYASWNPPYLLLIFGLTLVNYGIGRVQGNSSPRRRSLLWLAVAINVLALGVFKYLGWLDQSASSLANFLGLHWPAPVVQLALPIGLSFFTFEFLHYQIDLYRGSDPITNPIRFALFPAFFPTQIAGPIKRYQDFDEQVRSNPKYDPRIFLEGIELIVIGMFKKAAIADNVGRLAMLVFSDPSHAGMIDAWAGALAFFVELYFDFSAYTDIARGSAQLFGYRIPLNFRQPFLATTFQDFWQRWHMSLTFWLRDYVYYPVGQTRLLGLLKPRMRAMVAVVITLLVCGVWHGAGWNFVAMGLALGFSLVIDRVMTVNLWRREMPIWLRISGGWVQTEVLLLLSMVFFPNSISTAFQLWGHMFFGGLHMNILTPVKFLEIVGIFGATCAIQLALRRWPPRELVKDLDIAAILRPAYSFAVAGVALYFAVADAVLQVTPQKFIYFQF
jgi:D-alanyl-lipoteichoic acid acyltransferase DltB (MBOAT superfamily)